MSHKHTSKRLILDRKSELCLGLNPNGEIKETPVFEQILSFYSCQSPELELSPMIECKRVWTGYIGSVRGVFIPISRWMVISCGWLYSVSPGSNDRPSAALVRFKTREWRTTEWPENWRKMEKHIFALMRPLNANSYMKQKLYVRCKNDWFSFLRKKEI